MVSFSNTDGAHYDSVNGQSTVPSKLIQMDVKIPVQPSNFDALQKGALMGASMFMEHDKTHYYQIQYAMEFIPSPGTIFRETSLTAGFLLSAV
ncbi:hypothetical protein [Yersinia vastinensis]|uniref:hypothetical protein n=1 Tax=Yersinia vastinensis TaxID=2890318 RepID=UPI0011A030E1|nr:hypothetical protein [Yersinia vastinensis]